MKDETHFLFLCKGYDELREIVQPRFPNFKSLPNKEKFKILMSIDYVRDTAEFLYKSYNIRRSHMYNQTW